MHKILVALALTFLTAGPAAASDQTDVMVPVHQFIDGFNKGDTKAAVATCADEVSIIDEFAPFEWHGAGACSKWANDFDADSKKNGITDAVVTLGKPLHIDVVGDRAYVVAPADFVFKVKGKPTKETSATMTLTLHKGAAGWRITGWAWSKP
jgi:ketosteroid isomerase-like protein